MLGPPLVALDGATVVVDTRKATAMLAYLSLDGPVVARSTLASLLWPEYDDDHARAAFRRTLSTLRAALGGRYVSAVGDLIRLDEDGLDVDVVQVRACVRGVHGHDHRSLATCAACRVQLSEAAALHRGEFMAGFGLRDSPEWDDWQNERAGEVRREQAWILETLVELEAAAGDQVAALEHASRWLAIDPLHEPAHRALMRIRANCGDRSGAVRQYRDCTVLLDRELGVEPLPETTALHEAILSGTVLEVTRSPASIPSPAPRSPTQLPLLGRTEVQRLLLDVSASPEGRLVLIEGEAGIGKTRLAAELITAVEGGGGRVLEIRGYPGHHVTPYAPIVDLLARVLVDDPKRLDTFDPGVRDELARLVPGVAPGVGSGDAGVPTLDGAGAEARFIEAVATTLGLLAGTLLLIDDAQWVDPATLNVIGLVSRRAGQTLVAISRRPVDPPNDPLLPLIADARRTGRLIEVNPRRLRAEEVAELVALVGAAIDPEALYTESAGVPFYIAERLAALAAGVDPQSLPAGIRDLVRMRLAACSAPAQQILSAGAVIGRSFEPDLVREVSGRSPEEVADALDELGAQRMVIARHGRMEIDHDLTRNVILEDLGLGRRRLLHRRAADALKRVADRHGTSADVAAHLHAAGDDEGAAEWYRAAGVRASGLHAHAEAISHFSAALALAAEPDPELHERVGERAMLLGRYADAAVAFETAAASMPALASWRAEIGLARAHRRLGNLALADAHLDAALAGLGSERLEERAAALVERALIADRLGRDEEAAAHAAAVLDLANIRGEPMELAQAHNLAGLLARHRGDATVARRHLTDALNIAATLPGQGARMAALNNLALLDVTEGSSDVAEARLRQAIAIATATVDRHHEAALRNNLADLLNASARRPEAIAEVTRSATILAELGGLSTASRDPTPEVWRLVDW